MTTENQPTRDPEHSRRLAVLEEDLRDFRDDLAALSRAQGSDNATMHVLAARVGAIADRPPPWHNLIAAIGVAVTIWVLSLTPIAWLAVQNNAELKRFADGANERGQMLGQLGARLEKTEEDVQGLDDRFSNWLTRIEDRFTDFLDEEHHEGHSQP